MVNLTALNHQTKKGDPSYCKGQHRQIKDQHKQDKFYGGMICMDLWYKLINHGISKKKQKAY